LGKDRRGRWRQRERVDEKGQKELLGGITMDCSMGRGWKIKEVRIVMVKLVIQKKTKQNKKTKKPHQVLEQQKIQSFGKSSGVIP
jgi:hypothetical protein